MGQCTPEMTIVYDELIVQYFDLLSLFYGRALRTEETVATKAIRTGLHCTGYESITGFTDAVLLLCPRGCGKRVKCLHCFCHFWDMIAFLCTLTTHRRGTVLSHSSM